jgi:hypothetical protein
MAGRILTRQGEQRWAEIKAITRRLEDGAYVWDGIVWDISESKRIELELASSGSNCGVVRAPGERA